MLSLQIEWLSERGGRKINEDACGHWRSPHALCAVLADGAGGHGGGDVASRLAVSELVGHFAQAPTTQAQELGLLIRIVNDALIAKRVPGSAQQDMHSTVVCLVVDFVNGRAHWAHAGDSRLYWFRGGHVLQRTRDHSFVQSMVDAGMLAPDQVRNHPQRSELRSALGVAPGQLEVDAAQGTQAVEPGDVFLLCTDGLWETMGDATLERLLAEAPNPRAWLDALGAEVERVVGANAQNDNFTALAVWADAALDASVVN